MKWYKFLKYFLLPFAALSGLADLSSIIREGGLIYHLIDALFALARFVCFGDAFFGMIKMRESGPRCLLLGCIVTCCHSAVLIFACMLSNSVISLPNVMYLLGSIAFWWGNKKYFHARQHLFH